MFGGDIQKELDERVNSKKKKKSINTNQKHEKQNSKTDLSHSSKTETICGVKCSYANLTSSMQRKQWFVRVRWQAVSNEEENQMVFRTIQIPLRFVAKQAISLPLKETRISLCTKCAILLHHTETISLYLMHLVTVQIRETVAYGVHQIAFSQIQLSSKFKLSTNMLTLATNMQDEMIRAQKSDN